MLEYINSLHEWKYLGIVVAMLIDGNIAVLVAGFLASGGAINSFFGIIACIFGGFLEQVILYWAGYKLKGNESVAWKWLTKAGSHFDRHFAKRPYTALFVTKFIYGIHRNSLVRVAAIGTPFKKYLEYSVPVLVPWAIILFGIGFSVSKPLFLLLQNYIHWVEYGLLGLLVIIILFEHYILSGRLKEIWDKSKD